MINYWVDEQHFQLDGLCSIEWQDECMNNELERMQHNSSLLFKVLYQHLPGRTEENQVKTARIVTLWAES
jgi:hypothetical protein